MIQYFFSRGACSNDFFFLTSIKVKNVVIKNMGGVAKMFCSYQQTYRGENVLQSLALSVKVCKFQIKREKYKIPFGIFYFFEY